MMRRSHPMKANYDLLFLVANLVILTTGGGRLVLV